MSGRLFGNNNNNNSSSSSRGRQQQIVNKRNAIKFGTDELRNLDAVANDDEEEETIPQSQSYEQMMQKIGNRRNNNNSKTQQRTDETIASPSPPGKKNQRQNQKNSTKKSNKNDEDDVEQEEETTESQQEQAPLKPPYTPPEARLARWTFVFRNLFPTFLAPHTSVSTNMKKLRNQNRQKTTLMIEALERIDRWKRVTASHGLMMRLRKVPAYIDATKPLVEAIQMDRHLQEMREDLWRSTSSSTLNEKAEEEEDENDNEKNEEGNDNEDQESDAEEEEETTTKQQQQPSAASSPLHALLLQFPHNGTNNNNNQQQQALHQQITASTLPMVYASAISRAVFELTESQKKYSDQLDSKSTFRQRAQDIALPEELAEARNQIAHGRMPTLAQLRFAASLGLQYLHDFFWIPRSNVLKEYRVAKETYEKNIKNESGNNTGKGSSDSANENVASSSSVSAGKFGMRRQREENQKQQNTNNSSSPSAYSVVPPAKKMMSLEEMKAKMQAMKK